MHSRTGRCSNNAFNLEEFSVAEEAPLFTNVVSLLSGCEMALSSYILEFPSFIYLDSSYQEGSVLTVNFLA